jgi:hypothetical protein
MSDSNSAGPEKTKIAVGLLFMAVSVFSLLSMLGVLPSGHDPSDPAPSWIGWLIVLMFGGGGIVIITQALAGAGADGSLPVNAPGLLRGTYDVLSTAIVCALGAVLTWVAFGPGPRQFSIGFNGLWVTGAAGNDIIGRVAFGFVAVLVWIVVALMAVTIIRRWRR